MYKEERLNSSIKEIASDFFEKEVSIPGILLTVTRIELRNHFTKAQIFVTVYPDSREKEAMNAVKTKSQFLHDYFKKRLRIRIIPRFEILIDKGEKNREKIEEILKRDSGKKPLGLV